MSKIAFLVLSCDKYSDLWEPFYKLFNLHWKDCPFDKFFATNTVPFYNEVFEPILMGDETWSKGLYNCLVELEVKYQYVLITLEDLFIINHINTGFLLKTINSFVEINGNYLRLYVKRKSHVSYNEYFGVLEKNTPYRQNCVYSLWKIETLKSILNFNENAWEFEKKGVYRSYVYDGFFTSYTNHFSISNTVVKGQWVNSEFKKIKNIYPDLKVARPVMKKKNELILQMRTFFFNLFFRYTPWKFRNKLLKIIGKR